MFLLQFQYTCSRANITALNGTFQMITENDTVTVNIPVTVNHSTGNVTFNITARDAQNHTLYVTDANLTSGYVFVDTIKPNLTINGLICNHSRAVRKYIAMGPTLQTRILHTTIR